MKVKKVLQRIVSFSLGLIFLGLGTFSLINEGLSLYPNLGFGLVSSFLLIIVGFALAGIGRWEEILEIYERFVSAHRSD
jgi:hypothetical protein